MALLVYFKWAFFSQLLVSLWEVLLVGLRQVVLPVFLNIFYLLCSWYFRNFFIF